jgi:hypothetical protein
MPGNRAGPTEVGEIGRILAILGFVSLQRHIKLAKLHANGSVLGVSAGNDCSGGHQAGENANDGDYDQQFDQREPSGSVCLPLHGIILRQKIALDRRKCPSSVVFQPLPAQSSTYPQTSNLAMIRTTMPGLATQITVVIYRP